MKVDSRAASRVALWAARSVAAKVDSSVVSSADLRAVLKDSPSDLLAVTKAA